MNNLRIILFITFNFILRYSYSQDNQDYLIDIDYHWNTDGLRTFSNFRLCYVNDSVITSPTALDIYPFSCTPMQGHVRYALLHKDDPISPLGVYFWDDIEKKINRLKENEQLYYPICADCDNMLNGYKYSHWEGPLGINYGSAWLYGSTKIYNIPTFTYETHNCVADRNDASINITVTTNDRISKNQGVRYFLDVCNGSLSKYTPLNDVNIIEITNSINNSTGSEIILTHSYNSLTGTKGDSWWDGRTLYFRVRADFSQFVTCFEVNDAACNGSTHCGEPYYGTPPGTGYRIDNKEMKFYLTIPTPLYKVKRSQCKPDTIELTLQQNIVDNLSLYRFRLQQGWDTDGQTTNPCKLINVLIKGNVVSFISDSSIVRIDILPEGGKYLLEIFNATQDENTSTKDLQCAAKLYMNIKPHPGYLGFGAAPFKYEYIDSSSVPPINNIYHITHHGADDGKIKLIISNADSVKNWQYSNDGGNKWQDIPSSRLLFESYNVRIFYNVKPDSNYQFRIIDLAGCTPSSVHIGFLNEPQPLVISISNTVIAGCHSSDKSYLANGDTNGSIKVNWTGGIGPYELYLYKSSGDLAKHKSYIYQNSFQIDNLPAGIYNYKLTGYSLAENVFGKDTIYSYPDIQIGYSAINNQCYGDNTASLSVWANDTLTQSKTFVLKNNYSEIDSSEYANDTIKYTSLSAGQYYVKVISQYGCYDSIPNITIIQPEKISISATPEKIARYGGSTGKIDVTMTGGTLPYKMQFGDIIDSTSANSITYNNLKAGKYKVVLTDNHQCKDSISDIEVLQPLSALMFSYRQKNIDCFGNSTGSVSMTAGGGWPPYRYGWNGAIKGSDTTISGLPVSVNTDSVLVIDSMDVCETLPVSITQPELPLMAGIKNIVQPLCYGDKNGKITLSMNGGTKPYQISTDTMPWSSGDYISGLSAVTNYQIYVRDTHNCQTAILATIGQPTPVVASQVSVTGAHCNKNDGAIINAVSGGTVSGDYDYQWYYVDSSESIYNLAPELYNVYSGVYTFKVIDDHHCADSLQVLVSDTDGPVINAYAIDSVSCNEARDGGIHIKDISGGNPAYLYYLDNRRFSGDTSGIFAGDYQLRIEDVQKCKSYRSVSLPEPGVISIHSVMKNPTCKDYKDGAISLYPSGGNGFYRFLWNTPDSLSQLLNLTSGVYDATVLDRKNCFAKKKFELVDPVPPAPFWTQHEAVLCEGNLKTLDAGYFNSYCWYKGSDTLSRGSKIAVYQSGTYYLRITDSKGCAGLDSFKLDVSEHPLDAVLFVADSAAVGQPVTAVDVTWPVPDSIQWLFDSDVERASSNEWSQDFTFAYEGKVQVTLRAWYGGCYSDSTQSVCFHGPWDGKEKSMKQKLPLILNFTLYPNPSTGLFNAQVDLSREADISLTIYNSGMSTTLNNRKAYGAKEYKEEYNVVGYAPGIYLLMLRAGDEQRIMKIVIE